MTTHFSSLLNRAGYGIEGKWSIPQCEELGSTRQKNQKYLVDAQMLYVTDYMKRIFSNQT